MCRFCSGAPKHLKTRKIRVHLGKVALYSGQWKVAQSGTKVAHLSSDVLLQRETVNRFTAPESVPHLPGLHKGYACFAVLWKMKIAYWPGQRAALAQVWCKSGTFPAGPAFPNNSKSSMSKSSIFPKVIFPSKCRFLFQIIWNQLLFSKLKICRPLFRGAPNWFRSLFIDSQSSLCS